MIRVITNYRGDPGKLLTDMNKLSKAIIGTRFIKNKYEVSFDLLELMKLLPDPEIESMKLQSRASGPAVHLRYTRGHVKITCHDYLCGTELSWKRSSGSVRTTNRCLNTDFWTKQKLVEFSGKLYDKDQDRT